MKDKIKWFGEKGNEGVEVMKTAGKAIIIAGGLVVLGVALGAVNHAFSWGGSN
jgi:hypothetical protein